MQRGGSEGVTVSILPKRASRKAARPNLKAAWAPASGTSHKLRGPPRNRGEPLVWPTAGVLSVPNGHSQFRSLSRRHGRRLVQDSDAGPRRAVERNVGYLLCDPAQAAVCSGAWSRTIDSAAG